MMTALVLAAMLADPEPPAKPVKPREIAARGLAGGKGEATKPTRIKSAKELAEIVGDKGTRAEILKKVDFRRECLLLFRWSGSGGDRLYPDPDEERPGIAAFLLESGKTKDKRLHAKRYAVPAKAKCIVKTG